MYLKLAIWGSSCATLLMLLSMTNVRADEPLSIHPDFSLRPNLIQTVNGWQRFRGRGYSSGYHVCNPGILPHENWNRYQDLQTVRHGSFTPSNLNETASQLQMDQLVNRALAPLHSATDEYQQPAELPAESPNIPAPYVDPPSPSDRIPNQQNQPKQEQKKFETESQPVNPFARFGR
jgi:hypothetical protein